MNVAARCALIIVTLSIGIVTALADTKLPAIAERTKVQIKTISAVVGSPQSAINSTPLHTSNIFSIYEARDDVVHFHFFGSGFVLTYFSTPRFFFIVDGGSWIHDYSLPFSKGTSAILAATLFAIGFGLAGLGVYKSRDIGGLAVLITFTGFPFVVAGMIFVFFGFLGWDL